MSYNYQVRATISSHHILPFFKFTLLLHTFSLTLGFIFIRLSVGSLS